MDFTENSSHIFEFHFLKNAICGNIICATFVSKITIIQSSVNLNLSKYTLLEIVSSKHNN